MRTGSLKRIAAHSFLATFAVFAMGAASVAALTVPSTSVSVPKTTVTVNTPTVRVPSTAPAPAPAPKVTAPAPAVKVSPPKAVPVVKQVTKPVTKVVPKATAPVTKTVPQTVKKAVPKVTNPVKQTTGTVGKTISKTGSQVTGGGTGSRPSGPSGPVSKAIGTVKSLSSGATSGAGGAVRNTVGSVGTVGGTTGLVNSGAGSSVGSNGLFSSQGGSQGGMTWLGGPGGFFGGGSSGGDFPGGSAGMGGGGGSLAAMLVGASPKQLRNVLSHLEGCLPALPAIDRQVISMRAGVGGAPLTRPQVGQRLGLSRQAVRNTERRALNRLQYAAANTNCAGTVVGPFDVAGIGNLTPQLLFAGAVPVNVSSGTLTAEMPSGGFEQTRGILPRAASPLFDLGGGGGSGPAWAIILFTVLFSVSIAALTRELRSSF